MGFRASILLISSLFWGLTSFSQDKSNRGKEFWLGYGYSWIFDNENPQNSQELTLYLSTDAPANVTVSVTNTGWSQTVNIPANTVDVSIKIPKSGANDARIFNEGLFNRAVHIVSDTPIVVFAHTFNTMISAATMLMPVETYGYKYFSLNYSQSQSGSSPPNPPINTTQNGPAWYSWFYVIASEDNTRLEITPSDTTRNGWLSSQTYTVNLNKGEIYNVMGKLGPGNKDWEASKDMTGSKVLSVPGSDGNCHPIALFSGSGGIRLCKNDGGENMQQQVFPTQAWGTRYLTYHTLNNTTTDINAPFKNFYRVAVADPTTVVKRNGTVLTGLIKNFYYEFLDSTGGDYIEADKPILMAQYTPGGNRCYLASQFAYGDPEMFYLSPLEQGKKDVLFYANRNSFIDYNYLNLIVSNAGLNSLRLDGNPFLPANTKPHPNHSGYSVAVARIPGAAAQHRITCDSIFTGTMYGLGFFESYGYNVGTFINNLNNYIQIQNTLNTNGLVDTFTCPKTPVRFYAKLAYPANSIHWKLSQVPGIIPNTDSIITSPVPVRTEIINGRTYYVYTLQQDFTFPGPGTYQIPVSYSAPIIENCNQTENAFLNVLVKDGPKADFSISNQLCLADTVRFTGTTSTNSGLFNYTNYLWNFDDASTQNTINAKKRFASTGPHDVRYRVYADNGCIGDTIKTVTIINGTGPQLSLAVTGTPCKDSVLTFTSSIAPNANNPTSWYWDFGGGQTITSATSNITTHSFGTAGTNITVRHSATLTNGCQPDTITTIIPVINPTPLASFSLSGNAFCRNEPILFTSAATGVTAWNWDFGNGTGNNVPPFSRSYATAGVKTIQLTIKDINGCGSLPASNSVTIIESPLAKFGFDRNICVNDSIRFSDSSSTTLGTLTSWKWIFGDGNIVTYNNKNPFYHTYTTTGTFPVSLIVTSSNGCVSDTFRLPVTVNSKPTATFNFIGKPCIDSVFTFSSSVPAGGANPPTWIWNFGDLQTFSSGTSNAASHAYASSLINITVKHLVDLGGGCRSDTATLTIPIIHSNPVASFTLVGNAFCQNDPVLFSSAATGVTSWNWNFGNGTGTNVPPFSRPYIIAGSYTIQLTVKDVNGCGSLSSSNSITINPGPAITAGPDKFIKLGSSTTLDAAITNPANYDYLWSPSAFLNSAIILNPVSTPDKPMTYTIQATDKLTNCTSNATVIVTTVSDIYIPNSFTPNNDGKNDKWVIPGLALYPEAVVSIYNRGGQKIFESKGYIANPWNGTYKGVPQPTGVYVYLVQLNDDKKQLFKGTVAIIR